MASPPHRLGWAPLYAAGCPVMGGTEVSIWPVFAIAFGCSTAVALVVAGSLMLLRRDPRPEPSEGDSGLAGEVAEYLRDVAEPAAPPVSPGPDTPTAPIRRPRPSPRPRGMPEYPRNIYREEP
jgi:hypothetical protein